MTIVTRLAMVVGLFALWQLSQKLLGQRGLPTDGIGDKVHQWLTPVHRILVGTPSTATALLVTSSLGIDFLGLSVLGLGVFGATFRPVVGLGALFLLRQISQYMCALPPPQGMIWRDPGIPSLFVTYGVTNDLFFSGHTALAVYGGLTLAAVGWPWLGLGLAFFEMFAVLALRAHWTMDVYAGVVTALLCFYGTRLI